MRIRVNGQDVQWSASSIDYGAVLSIAKQPAGATVIYSGPRRGDSRRSGTLHAASQPIVVEDGMIFDAVMTGNA